MCYGIFSRRNIDPEVESTGSDSPMGIRDSGVPYPLCSEDEETIDALNSRYFRSDSDLGVSKMLNSRDVRPDFYDLGVPESVVDGGFKSNYNASGGLEFDDSNDLGHFNANRKVGVENGHLAPQFWDRRPRILESGTPEFVNGKWMKGCPNSFGAVKKADFSEYSALNRGQKRHETSLGFNVSSSVTDSRETASLERESLGMRFRGMHPRTMDLGTPESIKSEEFDIGLKSLSNSSGIPEHGSFTLFSIPDESQEYRGTNAGFYASPSPASSGENVDIENESMGLPFQNPGWGISDLSALESINSRKFNSQLNGLSNNFSIAENFNFRELFDDQHCEKTEVRFYTNNLKEEQVGTVCLPNSSYAAVPPEVGKTGRSNSTYTTVPSGDFQREGFQDSENHKDANVRFYDTNSREEEVETICPSNSTSTTVTPEDFQIEVFEESLAAGSLKSHRSENGFTEEVSLINSSDFRSQIEKGVKLLSQIPFPSCTSLVSSSPAMPPPSFPVTVSSADLSSSNLKSKRRENPPSACVTSELLNSRTDELEGEGNFPFASVTESPNAVLDRKKSSPSRNSELLTPMNVRGIFKPKLHQHDYGTSSKSNLPVRLKDGSKDLHQHCYGSSSESNLQNSLKNVSEDLHQHVYGTSSKFNMLNSRKDGSKDLHQHGYDSSSKPCVSNSLKDVSEDLHQLGYGTSSNPNVSYGLHDGSKDLHQCSYHSSSMSNLHNRLKDVSQDLHQHSVGCSSKPNVPNILKDVSENLHQRANGPSSKSKSYVPNQLKDASEDSHQHDYGSSKANVLNSLKDVPEDLHQHGGVSSSKSNVLNSLKDESEDLGRNKMDLLEKEQLGLHFAKPAKMISVPASKPFPRRQAVSTVRTQNSGMKTERDGKTSQDGRDDNEVQKREKELGVEVMNRTGRKSRGTEDPTTVPKDPKGEMDRFHENVFVDSGEVFQNKDNNFQSDTNEIDKKAGEFIAKFKEQMRVEKGPVNEVDKQAGDFIAKFKERIRLEKAATRSR